MARCLHKLSIWLKSLFRRRELDQDLDEEIRSHLDLITDQKIAEGLTPEKARRAARIELGGVEQVKEKVRDARTGAWLETLLQDLRFGLRMLRKNPGFTIIAVVTLALGIGANTAIFSVVNVVLFRPLPIPDSDRVVALHDHLPAANLPRVGVSAPQFRDYSAYTNVFESTALLRDKNFNLATGGRTQVSRAKRVTASLFPLLGIRPVLGRTFISAEDMNPNAHVTVLSTSLWEALFGGDPRALGKSVWLDGIQYRIIGILPPSMARVDPVSRLWVPMGLTPKDFAEDNRWTVVFEMLARLRPGVSIKQASAVMTVEAERVKAATSASPINRKFAGVLKGFAIQIRTLNDELVGNVRQPLYLLFGAVLFVLLIACANIANLLLARGTARAHEIAIRAAIGAERRRIVAQLLTEALLLACFGGVLGLLFAYLGIRLLVRNAPASIPGIGALGVNPTVLGFALAVSVIAGVLFGMVPAVQAGKIDLTRSLNQTSGRGSARLNRRGLRHILIVSEVALTCVLLVGSGLLLRTLANLLSVKLGFDPTNVLTLRISPSATKPDPARLAAFCSTLLGRVTALAGVRHAALVFDPPLFRDEDNSIFAIRGYHPGPNGPQPHSEWIDATPDYFAAMGIPLLRGRIYTQSEMGLDWNKGLVVVIDRALAQRFWPGANPIGAQIGWGDNSGRWASIVGVVGTVRDSSLAMQSKGTIYFPWYYPGATLVVRTASDPRPLISAIRHEVHSVDPSQAVYDVETMTHRVADSIAQQRFAASLLGLFAALSVILAAVGLYGVMSYVVSRRTHEIGIRIALGAQSADILRDVLGQGGRLALVGVALGVVAALGLTRLMASMLYGVTATDPLTFAVVIALLLAIALLACWIPAWRAMRVDPMAALRHE